MDSEINRLWKKVENYPSPSAYTRLAELLRVGGELDQAETVCRRCIKEFPRNGQAYVLLANIEVGRGKRGDALTLLRESITNDPRCYGGFRMLADLCVEDRRLDEAVGHLQKILEFKPQDEGVRQRLEDLQQRQVQGFDQPPREHDGQAQRDGDTETIDLTGMRSLTTAATRSRPRTPTPPPGALSHSRRGTPLAELVSQEGVHGAVIADAQARALSDQGLADGQADLLAALAGDVASAAGAIGESTGGGSLVSLSIIADQGQVLCYRREGDQLMLTGVADRKVKAAMLEHRARQALIDLGAG